MGSVKSALHRTPYWISPKTLVTILHVFDLFHHTRFDSVESANLEITIQPVLVPTSGSASQMIG